jgi:acetyl esterase/lipase
MKPYVQLMVLLGGSLMMTGCTSLSVFIANIPTYFDDVKIHKDIVFHPEYNLSLDVYVPPPKTVMKSKAIVFFYGGSWESGDKSQYKFLGSALARQGYVVFIPNYRKYPDVKFPAFMLDAADAVKWVQQHDIVYTGKPVSLVIMGHSAGANIATLLLTDKSYLKNDANRISAGIGLSGAYDFTPNTEHLKDIFGPPEKYPLMRPVHFVDGDEPPMFLAYGMKDDVVAYFNFEHMKDKLAAKKVCVVSREYPSLGHVDMIAEFSWVGGKKSHVVTDVLSFLEKTSPCHEN